MSFRTRLTGNHWQLQVPTSNWSISNGTEIGGLIIISFIAPEVLDLQREILISKIHFFRNLNFRVTVNVTTL